MKLVSGNRVPIISCEKAGVKKHDLYDEVPSKVKRTVMASLPTPPPVEPHISMVKIGSMVKINGRDVPIQDDRMAPGNIPSSEREKIESKSLVYCRVNINTLKALRLGTFQPQSFFVKISSSFSSLRYKIMLFVTHDSIIITV